LRRNVVANDGRVGRSACRSIPSARIELLGISPLVGDLLQRDAVLRDLLDLEARRDAELMILRISLKVPRAEARPMTELGSNRHPQEPVSKADIAHGC